MSKANMKAIKASKAGTAVPASPTPPVNASLPETPANLPLTAPPSPDAVNPTGFPNAEQADLLRRYCKETSDELGKVMGILTGIIDYGVHTGSAETAAETSASVLMSFDYALTLARNLSYLAGLVSGGNRFEIQRFDIAQLLMDTYMLNQRYLTHRQTFPTLLVDSSCLAEVDPNAIHQIVSNLLTRAGRNVAPGGKVTLSLQKTSSHVEIVFSETRSSLPLNLADLDLQIVRLFAEAHNGEFAAASEKGETRFTIRLPYKEIDGATNNLNKRRNRRARIQFPIDFKIAGQGWMHSHSVNLSVQGVFIAFPKDKYASRPTTGQTLTVKIGVSRERALEIPDAKIAAVLESGFGVEFSDLDDKTRRVLAGIVKSRPY